MLVADKRRVEIEHAPLPAESRPEAVATAFPLATEAALEILRAGGNAMDAAVAAAWALCACEPSASGLGGQTVLLLHGADGSTRIIDGQSRAPAAASLDTITARDQRRGHRSTTVPSTAATLDWAQRAYGTLDREHVMAPAIRIAEEGYPITALQHRQTRWVADLLRGSPTADLFLPGGRPPEVGSVFRQPKLAATLRRMSALGIDDFYRGDIARQIAADMRACGGLITEADLASCGPPTEMEPLSTIYGDHRILSAPPPAGGLQLLLGFNVLAELAASGLASSDAWYEAIALTTSAVFREREHCPLIPGELTPHLRRTLLGRDHARRLAAGIVDRQCAAGLATGGTEEPGDTTHLSVCDRHGTIVLLTQSIQSLFGAKVAHRDLGFLYNNYLYTCPRRPHPYALQPRCRPRSNIAPALVLRAGHPVLALGAAGSRRIISSILQVVSGVVDRGLGIADALASPRVHGLVGRKVWIERPGADDALLTRLHARGREPVVKSRFAMGAVHALQFMADGRVTAAADPRRDGTGGMLH